jgi:predicted metal-binding membrane protein
MSDAVFEVVLRRDRIVVIVALATITAVAWGYVLWLAADMDMGGVEMSGFRMIPAGVALMAPALAPWHWFEFVLVLVMWIVMMVGMMTPSAAPMILIYARVGRLSLAQGTPFAAAGWFVAGYLLTWSGFSLAATTVQWALERATLLDSRMAASSSSLGAIVLIAAGIYQWTSLKEHCLRQCRAPLAFIQQQGGFRRDARGALLLGLKHGAYCLGCCWMLMALLFVGGVMNVLWIAAIAIFVLAEKAAPLGRLISHISGLGFVASGSWLLLRSAI